MTQDFVPGPVLLRLLDVLSDAEEGSVQPVLVLDEINVSPPHIYLAPLLSALERAVADDTTVPLLVAQSGLSEASRNAILAAEELHPILRAEDVGPFVRLELDVPPQLRVVGTLNFDASTEDLAPKLLSRSFVVWFEPPSIGSGLELTSQTSYASEVAGDPVEDLSSLLEELSSLGFPVPPRVVRRAQSVLDELGQSGIGWSDILLSGLVLPQVQTVMEGQADTWLDEGLIGWLPDGLFRRRLERMREQLKSEGMANLWLISQ